MQKLIGKHWPLKLIAKRRNLKKQTNLFHGFALNAQRRNTEK
jgi:hypothetical protein